MSIDTDTISLAQCRAARGLLDWSQERLAEAAKLGVSTVRDFEAGRREPRAESLGAMRRALEKAGVEFLAEGEVSPAGGVGVRLRKLGRKRAAKG